MSAAGIASVIPQDEIGPRTRFKKPNTGRLTLVPAVTPEEETFAVYSSDESEDMEHGFEDASHALDPHDELDIFFEEPSIVGTDIAALFENDGYHQEFVPGFMPDGFTVFSLNSSPRRPVTHCHCAEHQRLQRAATVDTDLDDPEQVYARCEPLHLPLQ